MAQDLLADDFGSVLRAHRMFAGLTQEALAHRSGVAVHTISDLERGRVRRPQRRTVDQLVPALAVPGAEAALISAARAAGVSASYGGARAARLPAAEPVPGFVGREQQLSEIDARLVTEGHRLLVLSGPPGVGKTSLARQWSHHAADRFAAGCLFLDLRGYSGLPLPATEALAAMLRDLGMAADKVPADQDAAIAMLHELTAGRRLLLILDNARGTAQVRPLIPASSSVTTIITSRQQLPGLVVSHAARTMLIGVMSRADSIVLLTRLTAAERGCAAAELDLLAHACADLPLALRLAAAQLSTMAVGTARSLAEQIAGSTGLTALAIPDDEQTAIWATFDSSYQSLSPDARRLFLVLGLEPVADFSAETAVVLTAQPTARIRAAIAELVSACLIYQAAGGRYTCHDLLRSFAAELAGKLESGQQRGDIRRLRWHLLARGTAAIQLLQPQMIRLPSAHQPDEDAGFASKAAASAWLGREVPGIIRIIRHGASDADAPDCSWQLADMLRGWFYHQRNPDWIPVTEAALAAAHRAGNAQAIAAMHASIGLGLACAGRWAEAVSEFELAIAKATRSGWRECLAAVTGNLGGVHYKLGDLDRARELYTAALDLNRALGNAGGQAIWLGNLGGIHRSQSHLDLAEACYRQALHLYELVGSVTGQAQMMVNLGVLAIEHSDCTQARELGAAALDLASQAPSMPGICLANRLLADAARIAEDPATALDLVAQALTESETTGDPHLIVDCLTTLAAAQLADGNPAAAAEQASRAVELAASVGYREGHEHATRVLAAAHDKLTPLRDASRQG
jgi:tetratricopeptide (TPR) repeat protein/transcriptional regulator with XRE-family HTH domain